MASLSKQDVRAAVMAMYPNPTWAAKVSRMADSQVWAIYHKRQESLLYLKENKAPEDNAPYGGYHQINVWEWLNGKEKENVNV